MTKFIKILFRILIIVVVLVTIIFSLSCSPQKRLDRLVKNNPELKKTDTIYSTKTFTVPAYRSDTSIKASVDLSGLTKLLEQYKPSFDTTTRRELPAKLARYILARPCLDGPVKIKLSNGGTCTINQVNGVFFCTVNEPAKKIDLKIPIVTMRVEAVIKYNWQMFVGGFFFGWLVFVIAIMALKPKIKNP